MKQIKLHYCDMWDNFDPKAGNLIHDIIARNFDVTLTAQDPDYVVCSVFGNRFGNRSGFIPADYHRYPDAVRIMYSGENFLPDLNFCDYGMGCDHLAFADRYLRLPHFAMYPEYAQLHAPRPAVTAADLAARDSFCNFTFSNQNAMPDRDRFFHMLNARKPVCSTGRHLRNSDALDRLQNATGMPPFQAKVALLQTTKFCIAFENSRHPGYTTEKIMHSLAARTVPIYLGDPRVTEDFNPDAFINGHDFATLDALVEEVMRIDADDDAWLAMINAAPMQAATDPYLPALEQFLVGIISQPKAAAKRRCGDGNIGAKAAELTQQANKRFRRRWFSRPGT